MERLTLGQLATAVGASRRWVLNALTRLDVPRRDYDEPLARRLSLARQLAGAMRMSLVAAFGTAGVILAETDPRGTWRVESADGAVRIEVDLPRFFGAYLPRLAFARSQYGERPRGKRTPPVGSALERARAHGVDTSLFEYTLSLTPAQRLAELDANLEFYRKVELGKT